MSIRSAPGLAFAPNRTPFPHPHPRRERTRLQEHALEREAGRTLSAKECTIKLDSPDECADKRAQCENYFYEMDSMWYRCRKGGRRGNCRAAGTFGKKVPCDIPVRADAHAHAVTSEFHPRTLHSVRRKCGSGWSRKQVWKEPGHMRRI